MAKIITTTKSTILKALTNRLGTTMPLAFKNKTVNATAPPIATTAIRSWKIEYP